MVTVKKLLHEIFTEDTIKALAIGFMADDPRENLIILLICRIRNSKG